MRCISPIKASQNKDGDIVYNSKKAVSGLVGYQFDCRRCLPCRLNIAQEKAIRCIHEAKMHEENIFLTLTYDQENLRSEKLIYSEFKNFMRRVRDKRPEIKIPYMVTGEYGELNKRPHWHAIVFNYQPKDYIYKYTTKRGEKVYTSEELTKIWGKGNLEFGSVTIDSAGYVARYAAKKLVHGKDEEHDYHPIHKTSSQYGIGRSWIEKYYEHTFRNGFVTLPNGSVAGIPRYYRDWAKENKPQIYQYYLTEVQPKIMENAEKKARKEEMDYLTATFNRKGGRGQLVQRRTVELKCLERKFKQLQENLKL